VSEPIFRPSTWVGAKGERLLSGSARRPSPRRTARSETRRFRPFACLRSVGSNRRLIPTRDMARPVLLRRLGKKRSRLHLAPLWFGNPGTGAGGDTAGCGCPATTSHARTQAGIGFLVIGTNDTAAGFGCPGTAGGAPASDLAGQAHFIRVKKKGTGAMSARGRSGRKSFVATPEQRNNVKILVGLTLCLAWRERHSSD
jgi:hypothetical protein